MTIEYAVIGGGCFWCTEAIFKNVIRVKSVESGYTGSTVKNLTYEQVCSGQYSTHRSHPDCFQPIVSKL